MQVVLDHMPDHPLAREFVWLAPALASKDIVQVFRRPAGESVLDHLPGGFKSGDQFSSTPRRSVGLIPVVHWSNRCITFAHEHMKPADACADDMRGVFADGAQVWCSTQHKLLHSKRLDGPHEVTLVNIPAFIESR